MRNKIAFPLDEVEAKKVVATILGVKRFTGSCHFWPRSGGTDRYLLTHKSVIRGRRIRIDFQADWAGKPRLKRHEVHYTEMKLEVDDHTKRGFKTIGAAQKWLAAKTRKAVIASTRKAFQGMSYLAGACKDLGITRKDLLDAAIGIRLSHWRKKFSYWSSWKESK